MARKVGAGRVLKKRELFFMAVSLNSTSVFRVTAFEAQNAGLLICTNKHIRSSKQGGIGARHREPFLAEPCLKGAEYRLPNVFIKQVAIGTGEGTQSFARVSRNPPVGPVWRAGRGIKEWHMISKTLIVNGMTKTLLVNPEDSLADVLRGQLLLTSVKVGCGTGQCGARNVILDGKLVRTCTPWKMKR